MVEENKNLVNESDDVKTGLSGNRYGEFHDNSHVVNSRQSVSKGILGTVAQYSDLSRKILENIQSALIRLANFAKVVAEAIPTNYMEEFVEAIKKIFENPDNVINYYHYEKQLKNFHWAWPYDITTAELKSLIETVDNEQTFDKYMLHFFDFQKINVLLKDIGEMIPSHHRILFRQIKNSYNKGDYAIANNALLTILDNLLSDFLYNKGITKRKGIFKPIVDLLVDTCERDSILVFQIMMLAHNIDFIFQDYKFNEPIIIETNKQARRHTALHGVKYSNKKIDTIMLLNTLYEVLLCKSNLKIFTNTIVFNKRIKEFEIQENSRKKVLRPILADIILESLDNDLKEKGLSHKEIMEKVVIEIPKQKDWITSRMVTDSLQYLKRHDKVEKVQENTVRWRYKNRE